MRDQRVSSRSLSACEGAILVVDSTQGVEAQTLANVYLAIDQGLEVLTVLNKIDLPSSDVEGTKEQIEQVIRLHVLLDELLGVQQRRPFLHDVFLIQVGQRLRVHWKSRGVEGVQHRVGLGERVQLGDLAEELAGRDHLPACHASQARPILRTVPP